MNTTTQATPLTPQSATINEEKEAALAPYDSNPFTISFKGFTLLVEFAKGVFLTILVFGILGMLSNFFSSLDSSTLIVSDQETGSTLVENSSSAPIETAEVFAILAVITGVVVVVFLVSIVLTTAFNGFVAAGAVAASERRTITFSEALNAMADRFSTLFKAHLIASLKILGGFFLFIIPGVRASLRYQVVPYLIMSDPKISASQSLSESKRLYNKHLMEVLGIMTVGSIVPLVGSAFSASGMALSAQQIKLYDAAKAQTPKTHWLNYLGLGLLLLVVVLILMVMVSYIIFVNS